MSGKDMTFEVKSQPSAGYLALPTQPDAPGVIVLHAWWGLNQIFKNLCDRLASEGFAAFAPDLNQGKIARTIDEAKQLMSELPPERKEAIVAAAPEYLRSRPEVRNDGLALIGFSMGAAWSLVLASESPEDILKVVLFYGVYDVDFSKIQADILGHYGSMDEEEPLDGVRAMEAEMRTAGLKPTFHIYPDAKHWFFEEDRPEYDPQAAELAWRRTLEFLHG
ncbi:MAG TPA: dienelactone hydrolase family protein [Anaerolineales bacterium]|nr:dienelactone hydrolase family protein [Anaerolineales bacterium]